MKREYEAKLVEAYLIKMELDSNMAMLEFETIDGKIKFSEELDLLDTHDLFRFSMFLESFHIKNLEKARQLLNIFIKNKIKIGLMIDDRHNIIYSNMLEKDQLYEFKKHILLAKLIRNKKITKEMYEEMKTMMYKEVRSVLL